MEKRSGGICGKGEVCWSIAVDKDVMNLYPLRPFYLKVGDKFGISVVNSSFPHSTTPHSTIQSFNNSTIHSSLNSPISSFLFQQLTM